MATSSTDEFAHGALELSEHRKHMLSLRAGAGMPVGGPSYGLSAYGSPIGSVTGVQQPGAPTQPTPPAGTTGDSGTSGTDTISPDQFGGLSSAADAGDSSAPAGAAAGGVQ